MPINGRFAAVFGKVGAGDAATIQGNI